MIDITKLDPVQLDRFIHLQSIIDRQQAAAEKVIAAREYYRGEHPVLLTQRQEEYLGKQLTGGDFPFNHNIVKPVIDTLRERLEVTGFTVDGAGADDNAGPEAQLAALLWDWWKLNKMESQQIRLYRRMLRDGKSYIMVDYDSMASRPRLTLHDVDDGKTGIVLHRDPEDENRVLFVSRYFYTFDPLNPGQTGIERKTVYLPGEIRKYKRTVGSNAMTSYGLWQQIMDPGDAVWPLPWVDSRGQPLGEAVVEFQNPGGSEVDLIAGLQNALNKAWLDLLAAADTAGFPVMAIEYDHEAGPVEAEDDADLEDSDEFRIAPGRAIEIFGGQLKRIEGARLGELIDVVWAVVNAISGTTRTPHQYLRPFLTADVPSGEALKQLEAGLVAKAEERHLIAGEAWSEVMGLAYRVARTFGAGVPDVGDAPVISAQWADANTRMEKVESEVAQIWKALGLPDDVVWEKAGMTPEQIAQFKEQTVLRRAQELATIAAAVRAGQTPVQAGAAALAAGGTGTNGAAVNGQNGSVA